MKKIIISLILFLIPIYIYASETVSNETNLAGNAKSAVILEQSTGRVLFEKILMSVLHQLV